MLHIPTVITFASHHVHHCFVTIFFQQWQHAGQVVLIAVIGGDHQVLLAVLQTVDKAFVGQITKRQGFVAEPLHQSQMLLEHGDRHPGTMHPLLAILLDKAVVHDDGYLAAQGFDYGILIDGFEAGYYPLQAILILNALPNGFRHHLACEGGFDFALQRGKIDGQILGADIAKITRQSIIQILFGHQTNCLGFTNGKGGPTAEQCFHRYPTGTDHQIATRQQSGHIIDITDKLGTAFETGKALRHLGTADNPHLAGIQIEYLVEQTVTELPFGAAQTANDGNHRLWVVRRWHKLEFVGFDTVAQHLHDRGIDPQIVDYLMGNIFTNGNRPIAECMEGLARSVHRLATMHRGDHRGASQLASHIAAPAGGAGVSMHQLNMMLLDEIDEVKDVPEAAQNAALVESQLEDGAKRRLGQGI